MTTHGIHVATLDGSAESCGRATLFIVLESLPQDGAHHATSLAGAETRVPTNALRRDQRSNYQRGGK